MLPMPCTVHHALIEQKPSCGIMRNVLAAGLAAGLFVAGIAAGMFMVSGQPEQEILIKPAVHKITLVAGENVVQLYARDVLGSVPRPVAQLVGFRRVALEPGESVTVTFTVPTTRIAFSDRALRRVVEPGTVELWVGDAANREAEAATELTGDVHVLTGNESRFTTSTLT